MNCSQVQKRISAYLDGEIRDNERQLIEEHIKTCTQCSKELTALTELGTTLDTLKGIQVPTYFRAHVKQRIKDQAFVQIPFFEKIRRVVFPLAATAAIVVSLLFGNYIGKSLYQNVAEITTQENSEVAGVFGLSSLNEFPEGSLSNVYYNYVPGGD
ncbi:MAG: zf-HC2 domain-containing protein [bacterium]